jgi:uroporphyrinogen III methyltransferase/synthase
MTSLPSNLYGKRILITRPRAQASEWCQRLAAFGAQPIVFPMIEIAPPESYAALDQAITSLVDYDWLIFTSVNGVAAFWSRV